MGRNRNKNSRKRRRVGSRVRWKDVFIYGPLIVLLLAFFLGPYLLDMYLHEHPTLWNIFFVLAAVVVIVAVIVWPKKKSCK